jgi:transcriptional regulator with XRE-family HTH domain
MLNVDGATISSWEQGESQPYKRKLDKIHSLFNEISDVSFGIDQSDRVLRSHMLLALLII